MKRRGIAGAVICLSVTGVFATGLTRAAASSDTPASNSRRAVTNASARENRPTAISRPNIILILTDDQQLLSADTMPTVLARFAQEGMVFRNFFASTPLCGPSRATILTGRHAHNHGLLYNAPPMGGFADFDDSSTIATWLKSAGYTNGLFGKYMNFFSGTYVPPGWDDFHTNIQEDVYYDYDLSENGVINHYGTSPADYMTDVMAARALNFINTAASPFFVYFPTVAPHSPATPAPRHAGLFTGLAPWRPVNYNEADVSDKPAWVQALPLLSPSTMNFIDNLRLDQYRSLQAVDEAIASFIAAVEARGETNNTVLIFGSDNGYMWGEHRLRGKGNAFEESIRVPLLIRYPGTITGPLEEFSQILTTDLAPTIAQLAGVVPPAPVDGLSMVPLVLGTLPGGCWRDDLLVEVWGNTLANPIGPVLTAVRDADWTYVDYTVTAERELYDHFNDRWQLANVAGVPAYATIQATYASRLAQLAVCAQDTCRPYATARELGDSLRVTQPPGGGASTILWTEPAGLFNVYRGSASSPATWDYNQTCLAPQVAGTSTTDAGSPPAGLMFWYLVTRDELCSESVLGRDGGGTAIFNSSPCLP